MYLGSPACACSRSAIGVLFLLPPLLAEAQQVDKVHRIGFLGNSTPALEANLVGPFREGLRELGYVEGRNILIEYRWAEGKYERLAALVAELLARNVDVIVTAGAYPAHETFLQAYQADLASIGVKLNIQQLDSATRIAKMKAGDYQILTSLWTNDINDPGQITSYFTYYPVVESNWAGYKAPDIEELFVKSESEVDVEKRRALYKQIQEKQLELAPQMYLLEVPYTVALQKKVKNFVQIPLGNYIFSGVSIEK